MPHPRSRYALVQLAALAMAVGCTTAGLAVAAPLDPDGERLPPELGMRSEGDLASMVESPTAAASPVRFPSPDEPIGSSAPRTEERSAGLPALLAGVIVAAALLAVFLCVPRLRRAPSNLHEGSMS